MTQIEALYVMPEQESPARRRIRMLSLPFELTFGAGAVLAALLLATILVLGTGAETPYLRIDEAGAYISIGTLSPAPAGSIPVSDLPLATRLVGAVGLTILYGSLIAAFASLRHLFGHYRRGEVFSPKAVGLMRQAGIWLIVFALAPAVGQPLMRSLGSPDRAWFHGVGVVALVIGGALFVLALITQLGREIERDVEGYV